MYNLTINYTELRRLKQFLIIFDGTLVAVNLILGCFIASAFNQMPFDDAISKFIVLATGAAIIYYSISLAITLLISKLQNKQDNVLSNFDENNNPFTFTGRIARKPYLITKFSMSAIFLLATSVIKHMNLAEYSIIFPALIIFIATFIAFAVGLIAASKRLRDVQWSQLFLIIWAIPFIGLIIGVPLLFMGSKQSDN
jgi:membrane protein